jgi:hypothetical protein
VIGQQQSITDTLPFAQPLGWQARHTFGHLTEDEHAAHRTAVDNAAGSTGGEESEQHPTLKGGVARAQTTQPMETLQHRQRVPGTTRQRIDVDQC